MSVCYIAVGLLSIYPSTLQHISSFIIKWKIKLKVICTCVLGINTINKMADTETINPRNMWNSVLVTVNNALISHLRDEILDKNLRDQMSDNEQFGELRLTRSKLYTSPSVLQINEQARHCHYSAKQHDSTRYIQRPRNSVYHTNQLQSRRAKCNQTTTVGLESDEWNGTKKCVCLSTNTDDLLVPQTRWQLGIRHSVWPFQLHWTVCLCGLHLN